MKKIVRVQVSGGSDHWQVKFPDKTLIARDKTMVRSLVLIYSKEHSVIATILWDGLYSD